MPNRVCARPLMVALLLSVLGLGIAAAPAEAAPAASRPVAAAIWQGGTDAAAPIRPVWHRGYAHGRGYYPPPRRYRGPPPGHWRRGPYYNRGYYPPPRRYHRPPPRPGYYRPY